MDQAFNEIDLDELTLSELNLKKSVSTPPPGLYQDSSVIFKNGEIVESDLQNSKEITELIRNLKKYNPRIVNCTIERIQKEKELRKNENTNPELYYPSVVSLKEISKNEKVKENENPFSKNLERKNNKRLNVNATVYSNENRKIAFNPNFQPMYCDPSHAPNPFITGYQNEDKNEKFTKSKNIQSEYESGDFFKKNQIYQFALSNMHELIQDTYYNYIIQKILEIGLKEHKIGLFQQIKIRFLEYSYQKYGCRVIQKTLEDQMSSEYQLMFGIVKTWIADLFFHENGNFVIQKCLEIYQDQDFCFLLLQINLHVIRCEFFFLEAIFPKASPTLPAQIWLSYHSKAQRNLQRQRTTTQEQEIIQINEVLLKILSMSYDLSKKEYSNYIIQHILEAGHNDHKEKLLYNYIKPNFIQLSCDQFASNVSEKAIIFSDKEFRKAIWKGLKDFKNMNESLLKLVNDKYGNYVMQRVYEYSETDIQQEFENTLEQYMGSLNTQGQFVMKFIQKLKFK